MGSFKDQLQKDYDVFFNAQEFAETALIDGRPVTIILDRETLKKRAETEFEGLGAGAILYFAPASAFPGQPKLGSTQFFNKRQMIVIDVRETDGLLEIILDQTRG
ncbi:hypothetical protein [Gorillibacterium sp. sgz5001074]|uniref:hypothetical protein n=1 Tax=Gorillibacterium sp. sgz5001074 TaxID=3446695 RepID=UPI003F66E4BA